MYTYIHVGGKFNMPAVVESQQVDCKAVAGCCYPASPGPCSPFCCAVAPPALPAAFAPAPPPPLLLPPSQSLPSSESSGDEPPPESRTRPCACRPAAAEGDAAALPALACPVAAPPPRPLRLLFALSASEENMSEIPVRPETREVWDSCRAGWGGEEGDGRRDRRGRGRRTAQAQLVAGGRAGGWVVKQRGGLHCTCLWTWWWVPGSPRRARRERLDMGGL